MCGFLFIRSEDKVDRTEFEEVFSSFRWRGPDASGIKSFFNGHVLLAHHRLTILDRAESSNQPMMSSEGRYCIIFNGEIYNYRRLKDELNIVCKTGSDTEVVLNGYIKYGESFFKKLDGMFSFVIYDSLTDNWIAARDAFGIKPIFIHESRGKVVIGSEASAIAKLIKSEFCELSIREWEVIRRPVPGKTYFKNIEEILPGEVVSSNGRKEKLWDWEADGEDFSQEKFEELINISIKQHEMGDFENVALLSGGLDSAIISKIANVKKCYTVGLPSNNEFLGAQESAIEIKKELVTIEITEDKLIEYWRKLTKLRGEPLSLPNEGLIFAVCSAMEDSEKVVLTGEGADELFFGYDGIFRWAAQQNKIEERAFVLKYGYSNFVESERLLEYINELSKNKTPLDFVEDFFYTVHLPGLLRRMDFSSMAASKEARVPFISKSIIKHAYRKPINVKLNSEESKLPIRELAQRLSLNSALSRKKIGFSATLKKNESRSKDYEFFQNIVKDSLGWL